MSPYVLANWKTCQIQAGYLNSSFNEFGRSFKNEKANYYPATMILMGKVAPIFLWLSY